MAKKSEITNARNAGVDWVRQLIDDNPTYNARQIQSELQGGSLDLMGGDEVLADYAYEGGMEEIKKHFKNEKGSK